MKSLASVIGILVLFGCGGDGGDDDGGIISMECEDGAMASEDSFVPFSVGNIWVYDVTTEVGGTPERKRQTIKEEMTPEGESQPVIVQETIKPEGTTVSWLRRDGDILLRVRQEDIDPVDGLERVTTYDPPKVRFFISADALVASGGYTDEYTRIVTDPLGAETNRELIRDEWSLVAEDVPCNAGFAELTCLHVRRERVLGGISNKEFLFARGYGKVLETVGPRSEKLIGCTLQ